MENGFIHSFVTVLINFLYNLNAVEWWKKLYVLIREKSGIDKIEIYNEAIDLFILFKYLFLIYLYAGDKNSHVYLVLYLTISNLFTYFYYHVWESKESECRKRDQRRFISLILSILYSNICFGYLYKISLSNFEPFLENIPINTKTVYISFMTSFGSTLTPKNTDGLVLIFFNVVVNMLFVVIILSNTGIKKIDIDNKN